MAKGESFVLWSLYNLVGFDGAEGIGYASVTNNLLYFLLLHLSVPGAGANGGGRGRGRAAFSNMSGQTQRHFFSSIELIVSCT